MKSLSFYTVFEANYCPLGALWVKSLLDIMDNKVNKIFIYDIGLINKQKEYLKSLSNKVEILNDGDIIRSKMVHDEKWREAVSKKTTGLLKICKDENYPIVMMDADTMVIEDLSNQIHEDCDFQTCERKDRFTNKDGHDLTHIGCWFVVHNDKGKEFVSKWNKTIFNTEGDHRETPALCSLLKNSNNLNYKENIDSVVAAPQYNDSALVLHFKSEGPCSVTDPYDRLNLYRNLPPLVILKLSKFIEEISSNV